MWKIKQQRVCNRPLDLYRRQIKLCFCVQPWYTGETLSTLQCVQDIDHGRIVLSHKIMLLKFLNSSCAFFRYHLSIFHTKCLIFYIGNSMHNCMNRFCSKWYFTVNCNLFIKNYFISGQVQKVFTSTKNLFYVRS